jgi:N-[(2S)-2-amino-2-carboxyethyl]-L-glutamate dehydrogenase
VLALDEDAPADEWVLHLSRHEVVQACRHIDVVSLVRKTLAAHARGATRIPDEAYLGWTTGSGLAARCLAMPGSIETGDQLVTGLKVINASLANPARGLPRAQGFTMLFDTETARPSIVMEAAHISAQRTAAVTAVTAAELCNPDAATMAVLGCGPLARAHLAALPAVLPGLARVKLFDLESGRSRRLAEAAGADPRTAHLEVVVAEDPRTCVTGSDLIVTVTTVTSGYLPYAWLRPGAVVAHVSLDDVLPDVVARADLVLVDDWHLTSQDDRRLFGRMYRDGRLRAPGTDSCAGPTSTVARQVDGTLGEVLIGARPGRRARTDIILSNPFGMSVLDIAIANEVLRIALERSLGRSIPF